MDVVVGIILALSLLANGVQHGKIKEAESASERWQEVAKSNYDEWQKVIAIGETNERTIISIKASLDSCSSKNVELRDKINDFTEVARIRNSTIVQLQERLSIRDWSSCRVPDNFVLPSP